MLGLGTPMCRLGREVHRGFCVPEAACQQCEVVWFSLFVGAWEHGKAGGLVWVWAGSGTIRESGVRLFDVRSPSSIAASSALNCASPTCLGFRHPRSSWNSVSIPNSSVCVRYSTATLASIAVVSLAATGEQKAIRANSVDHRWPRSLRATVRPVSSVATAHYPKQWTHGVISRNGVMDSGGGWEGVYKIGRRSLGQAL